MKKFFLAAISVFFLFSCSNTTTLQNNGATGTGKSSTNGTTNKSTNSTSENKDTTGTDYLTTMAQTLSSLFKTGD